MWYCSSEGHVVKLGKLYALKINMARGDSATPSQQTPVRRNRQGNNGKRQSPTTANTTPTHGNSGPYTIIPLALYPSDSSSSSGSELGDCQTPGTIKKTGGYPKSTMILCKNHISDLKKAKRKKAVLDVYSDDEEVALPPPSDDSNESFANWPDSQDMALELEDMNPEEKEDDHGEDAQDVEEGSDVEAKKKKNKAAPSPKKSVTVGPTKKSQAGAGKKARRGRSLSPTLSNPKAPGITNPYFVPFNLTSDTTFDSKLEHMPGRGAFFLGRGGEYSVETETIHEASGGVFKNLKFIQYYIHNGQRKCRWSNVPKDSFLSLGAVYSIIEKDAFRARVKAILDNDFEAKAMHHYQHGGDPPSLETQLAIG